jgi:hypothetical protein
MPSKSPSKHLSLKFLVSIAESDFCNRDKGIDYEPSEVTALILEKQARTSEVLRANLDRANKLQIIELLKSMGKKICSGCGDAKEFEKFHRDRSKKTFVLRSHCKECRKIPF